MGLIKLGILRSFAKDCDFNDSIRATALEDARNGARRLLNLLDNSPLKGNSQILFSSEDLASAFHSGILELIRSLLTFEFRDVSSETLGSVVYRLVDEESGRKSHTVSEANALRILYPLLTEPHLSKLLSESATEAQQVEVANRILALKIFDPTNGTGTILATAISQIASSLESAALPGSKLESIDVANYAAVSDDPLGAEITRIVIWLTLLGIRHRQSRMTTRDVVNLFGGVTVYEEDPLTKDWRTVFNGESPDLVVGAPTFRGWSKMSDSEKSRFSGILLGDTPKGLDFSAAWLLKGANLVSGTDSQVCFATTNSLVQGEQVHKLWPLILERDIEIGSAFPNVKWDNDVRQDTGVSVAIVALRSTQKPWPRPIICSHSGSRSVDTIGPYLIEGVSTIVEPRRQTLSVGLPPMVKGNMPYDGQHLLLQAHEKNELVNSDPRARHFIRRIVGSEEFINGVERYCLWITEEDVTLAMQIPQIRHRIDEVARYRACKKDPNAQRLAKYPYRFRESRSTVKQSLVIPSVSSERRTYIPLGFVGPQTIVSNLCFVIYDCESWLLPLLSSAAHMCWVRTTCGYLETRLRYSNLLGYNTFPVPTLDARTKSVLTELAVELVQVREQYVDSSLGEMYSRMPDGLAAVHSRIDAYVDSLYGLSKEVNSADRIRCLMNEYQR
jgi:hypothetical protein